MCHLTGTRQTQLETAVVGMGLIQLLIRCQTRVRDRDLIRGTSSVRGAFVLTGVKNTLLFLCGSFG